MSGSISFSIESQSIYSSRQEGKVARDSSLDSDDSVAVRASNDYSITLSEESQQALNDENEQTIASDSSDDTEVSESEETAKKDAPTELTEEEQQKVDELQDRHDEVVTHEQAHASVGGQYAGSPQYTYEQGPDGQRYAVDGEVQIDVGKVSGDPEATITKMEQVYRAALAPAEPSAADQNVAREAQSNIAEAKAEIASKATESTSESNDTSATESKPSEQSNSTTTSTPETQTSASSEQTPNINSNQTLLSAYQSSYTSSQSSFFASA